MDALRAGKAVKTGPANDFGDETRPVIADAAGLARAHLRAQARAPQNRIHRRATGQVFQAIDLVAALLFGFAGLATLNGLVGSSLPVNYALPLLLFSILTPLGLALGGIYRIEPSENPAYRVLRAFIAVGLSGAAAALLARFTAPEVASVLASAIAVNVLALTLLHMIYAGFIHHWGRAGRLARNVVVVGATPNARKLILSNQSNAVINVVGVFDDRRARSPAQLAGAPYLGDTDDLLAWSLLPEVDRIVVTVSQKAEDRVRILLDKLKPLPQPVCLLLDLDGFNPDDTSLDEIAGGRIAKMSGQEFSTGWHFAKRAQDLVLGGVMFVAALPIMALIALLVRLDSQGPALFRQEREGFNGRTITVLKFRTMRQSASETATTGPIRQVEKDDPRVTRVGRFLRLSSLDELPQLWNVLRGDMSLVGPRPHAPGMRTGGTETAQIVADYAHRHRVKPGLTGWAQIHGSRGPLHSPEAARERIRLDVDYITRSNFWLDLSIIARTLPALLGDKANIR